MVARKTLPWVPEVFFPRAAGCFGVGRDRNRKLRMKSLWQPGWKDSPSWLTILRLTVRSFFTPLSVRAPLYWYLNLHKKGRSEKKDLWWHLEIEPGTSDFLHRRQHTYQLRQSLILFLYLQQLFNATKTGICSTCVRFVQPLSCFTCFSHLHLYFSTSQTSIYGQLVNKDTFYGPLSVLINGIWL